MKKFKMIDFWISVALIIVFFVLSIVRQDGTFILGYFVVGGWQVISMITHISFKWFTTAKSKRDNYHVLIFFILLAALVGLAVKEILLVLAYPMLFAAPFMALYYTDICYNEVYVKMKRPLSLLK